MTELLPLLISLLLILACGGFVAAEFALVTVNRATVESAAANGDKSATNVLAALRTLSTQLSGAQLGITVTNLAIGFLAEPAIAGLIDGPLESLGLSPTAARSVSITIALVMATTLTMVFGELIPKNLAIARPLATASAVQGFQRGFTKATAYIIRFCNGTANRILRSFGIEPQEELASARTPDELSGLVRHSAVKGTLAVDTATLVQRTLAFGERTARDVMTPRMQMTTVGRNDTLDNLVGTALSTGHSRFPVVKDGPDDDVLGVVHVRQALRTPFEERSTVRVRDVMGQLSTVPDTMVLDELLDMLREGGLQVALVIDEFGGVAGLVTLEDLVEELVGAVIDEHDVEEAESSQVAPDCWMVSALLRPDEAAEIVKVPIPEGTDYDTLGGLVVSRLGRLAAAGDEVVIAGDELASTVGTRPDLRLTVTETDGHRIDRLRIQVLAVGTDGTEPS